MQVAALDPGQIQARVDDATRDVHKMVKVHPLDGVVKKLAAELDAFKLQLPLLQEVRRCPCPPGAVTRRAVSLGRADPAAQLRGCAALSDVERSKHSWRAVGSNPGRFHDRVQTPQSTGC